MFTGRREEKVRFNDVVFEGGSPPPHPRVWVWLGERRVYLVEAGRHSTVPAVSADAS